MSRVSALRAFLALALVNAAAALGTAQAGLILTEYDDFSGPLAPVDTSKWNVSGTVTNSGERLNVWGSTGGIGTTSSMTTDDLLGEPIFGFDIGVVSNPSGGLNQAFTGFVEMTNGSDFIRFQYERIGNLWRVSSGGSYGNDSDLGFAPGEELFGQITPDGSDLVISYETLGVETEIARLTTSAAPGSYFRMFVAGVNTGEGETYPGVDSPAHGLALTDRPSFWIESASPNPVPEPASVTLLLCGAVAAAGYGAARRRKS